MGQQVLAGMTMSLDGYVTGPDDRPGAALGKGGEQLHYWVFGGPWSYQAPPAGSAVGADRAGVIESPFATHLRYLLAPGSGRSS
jgi:hypothetical protein